MPPAYAADPTNNSPVVTYRTTVNHIHTGRGLGFQPREGSAGEGGAGRPGAHTAGQQGRGVPHHCGVQAAHHRHTAGQGSR